MSDRRRELEAERDRLLRDKASLAAGGNGPRVLGMLLGTVLGLGVGALVLYGGARSIGIIQAPRPPDAAYPCGDSVVDLHRDPSNCGSCGNACSPGRPACQDGECVCRAGLTACSDDEACVDLATSREHCGACETECGEGIACVGGRCACAPGLTTCAEGGGEHMVLTCVDLQSDLEHCGECSVNCGYLRAVACVAGVCRCAPGQVHCLGEENANHSECNDLQNDSLNCGACSVRCPSACAYGHCM